MSSGIKIVGKRERERERERKRKRARGGGGGGGVATASERAAIRERQALPQHDIGAPERSLERQARPTARTPEQQQKERREVDARPR